MTVLTAAPSNRLFERRGEVLQNDNRLGAQIGELMLSSRGEYNGLQLTIT